MRKQCTVNNSHIAAVAVAIVFTAMLTVAAVGAPALSQAPITAHTTWQAPASGNDVRHIMLAIHPAGDDSSTDEPPTGEAVIAFHWTYDDAAWFPVWKASVAVHPGLGNNAERIDLINTRQPQPGHTYAMLIAYDPESGMADVQLTDVTAADHLLTRTIKLPPGLKGDQAVASTTYNNGTDPLPTTTKPYFTPVSTVWRIIAQATDGAATYLSSYNPFAAAGDDIHLQLTMPTSLAGHWQVVSHQHDDPQIIARIPADEGTHETALLTIQPEDLGPIDLRLQYVEGEHTVLSHGLPIAAGRIRVQLGQPYVKGDDNTAVAAIDVTSTSRASFNMSATARVSEITWSPDHLRYVTTPLPDLSVTETWPVSLPDKGTPFTLPMEVPVPKQPGTYKVNFTVEHDLPVPVAMNVHDNTEAITVTDAATEFSVVSYNIWGRNEWPTRTNSLKAVLKQMAPDIIAFQELKAEHFMAIADALPGYKWVTDSFHGWITEGNVFWSDDLFELVAHGAEDIGIYETWRRLFWVRLRIKQTNETIIVANAHYTWAGHARILAEGGNPRPDMARATVTALNGIAGPDEPVIFVGDLNESGIAIDVLRQGGFIDTAGFDGKPAAPTHPSDASFPSSPAVIDWQFYKGPLQVLDTEVVTFKLNGIVPSDHKPVWVLYGMK